MTIGHGGGHDAGVHGGASSAWTPDLDPAALKKEVHDKSTKGSSSPRISTQDQLVSQRDGKEDTGDVSDGDRSDAEKYGDVSNNSNNPKPPPPSRNLSANPPAGKGGTGNPFFNANPMVTFYSAFLNVIQELKLQELVSNKLAVSDMSILVENAKDQAQDIMKQAQAQASALIKQAAMQFVQAGMQGIMAFASVKGGLEAGEEIADEAKTAAADVKNATSELEDAKALASPQMKAVNEAEGDLSAKENMLAKTTKSLKTGEEGEESVEGGEDLEDEGMQLEEGEADELSTVNKNMQKTDEELSENQTAMRKTDTLLKKKEDDITKEDETLNDEKASSEQKSKAKVNKEKLEKQKEELTKDKEKLLDKNIKLKQQKNQLEANKAKIKSKEEFAKNNETQQKLNANKKAQTKIDEEIEQNNKDMEKVGPFKKKALEDRNEKLTKEKEDLQTERTKLLQDKKNQLQSEVKKAQQKLAESKEDLANNPKVAAAQKKADEAQGRLKQSGMAAMRNQAQGGLMNKPWFMTMQSVTGGLNQVAQGMSDIFDAEGKVEAAKYQADQTMLQAYQQILQTGMSNVLQNVTDAYQQAGEIAQTLQKLSDQEAQSMHWAV